MLDHARLIKLLNMFSSHFDGEVANAARMAHALVKEAGGWEKALDSRQADVATEACRRLLAERDELLEEIGRLKAEVSWTPDRWVEPTNVAEAVDRCIEYTEFLTGWEREFTCTLSGWRGPLTTKQSNRLKELVDKVRRIARARGLAA